MDNHEQVTIELNGVEITCDKGCVEMITLFNTMGLNTKFSCQGEERQDYYIMFTDEVTDQQIEDFMKLLHKDLVRQYIQHHRGEISSYKTAWGTFKKWCRPGGENGVMNNWVYEVANLQKANEDYLLFKQVIKKYGEGMYGF